MQAQFTTCVELLEARDLLRRLSFGNLILLQPELLNAYASSLINTVKDEPDGFGSIDEERVRTGDFFVPGEQRLKNTEMEKLLLIAMIEDLLRYDIVLREATDKGIYLVFPSQSTREHPDLPDPKGKAVVFSFAGSILHIYTTLAVRLANSGFFNKKEVWKNAVTYTAGGNATYGMFLQDSGMRHAELTLFFDAETSQEMRVSFEEYIQAHLHRRARPHTIHKRHISICQYCSTPFNELQIKRRQELGVDSITCSVCEQKMALIPGTQPRAGASPQVIQEIDQAANAQRDRETAKSILQGKIKAHDFDVFLCHNVSDKPEVKKIGEQLKERGILPWLDEWELRPGFPWQHALERNIKHIKSAAVFVGLQGIGPWQDMEMRAFLREFLKRECPVIPVILPNCDISPDLPIFLDGIARVDFRPQEADPDVNPMERLIWGVTGKQTSEH